MTPATKFELLILLTIFPQSKLKELLNQGKLTIMQMKHFLNFLQSDDFYHLTYI